MKSLKNVPRIAIIGLGDSGSKYLKASRELEKNGLLKVQATCDPQFLKSNASAHYQRFDALLDAESFDVALLTVPVVYRYQMTAKLLSKGISVVSPGPITASVKDLKNLHRLAGGKKLSVISTQIRFFEPSWIALKQKISNQRIKRFNVSFHAQLHPSVLQTNNEYEGIWFYQGWNVIQVLNWMFGNIADITLSCTDKDSPKENSVLAKIELQNGSKGIVSINSLQPKGELVRVKTNKALFSLFNDVVWEVKGQETYEVTLENVDAYQQQLKHCLNLVATQKSTFEMDKRTLQTIRNAQLISSSLRNGEANHLFYS